MQKALKNRFVQASATARGKIARRKIARRSAFTLVEILIVVLILAILAAIVVPAFSRVSKDARESMLRDDLRFMRSTLMLYRSQHRELVAGAVAGGTPDPATLVAQFTAYSDDSGNTSATSSPAFPYGPYLSSIPKNPLSDLNNVMVVTGAGLPPADDTTGWIYNATTQEFVANQTGADLSGTPYSNY
jgi:general secretion pathway protein G